MRPPPTPPDWRTGPPDFVGVGAQRSGSGWWYRFAIESHPRVVGDRDNIKELHYFDRFWNGDVPADFAERYHTFFPRPAGAISGEWTPRYMHDHWSIRLLREAAPEARLLVILRDPVERFRSALAAWPRRTALGRGRILDQIAVAVSRGAYAEQLSRLFDLFPREQVLVLQYERCVADPVAEMARTCRFLGLEPMSEPPQQLAKRSRPPNRKPELCSELHQDLVARLRFDVERLAIDKSLKTPAAVLEAAARSWRARGGLRAPLPNLRWALALEPGPIPASPVDVSISEAMDDAIEGTVQRNSIAAANLLIDRLGFPYIASVTWQTGLRHPTRGGLWLWQRYGRPVVSWDGNPVWRPRPVFGHNLTALSAATFFTLLGQGRLVNAVANRELLNTFNGGCSPEFRPALRARGDATDVAAKCGIWNAYEHEAALVVGKTYRYVAVCATKAPAPSLRSVALDLDDLIRETNSPPVSPPRVLCTAQR